MKTVIKSTLFVLILSMVLSLFSCNAFEHAFLGGDPYAFSDIVLTQTGIKEYRIDFTANCGRENVDIYITEGFRLPASVKPVEVEKTIEGGNAHFSFTKEFNLGEDYYLWIVNGEKQAKTSITIPSMFPSISTHDDGSATFEFKYTYGTPWGSFCDPNGKAVYKSSSPVFDENAVLIQGGIEITVETCHIPAEHVDENCYYFAVSTAKEGAVKNISSPVLILDSLKSQITGASATVTNDLFFQLQLNIPESSPIASSVEENLELLVKTDIADEVYVSDCVYENGVATMTIDMNNLLFDGLWYDALIAWNGTIVMDIPKYIGGKAVDVNSTVKKDGIVYGIASWKPDGAPDSMEMLKIYFEEDTTRYADEICTYLVTFSNDLLGLAPTLHVNAKFRSTVTTIPTLAITGGDETILASANGKLNDDGSYSFDLVVSSALETPDKWYDLRFFIGDVPYEMLKDSCITYENFSTKYENKLLSKTYEFKEWNGFLKLMYLDITTEQ